MVFPSSFLFVIAACFCFLIGLLIALSVFNGNQTAWVDGGLLSLAASFLRVPGA